MVSWGASHEAKEAVSGADHSHAIRRRALTAPPDDEREFLALSVLNCLRVEECIDLSAHQDARDQALADLRDTMPAEDYERLLLGAADGDPWPLLYPDFVCERLRFDPSFFRIDRLPASIFLLDLAGADDTLLRRIQRVGLTGLTFMKVWSSEIGPAEINLFDAP